MTLEELNLVMDRQEILHDIKHYVTLYFYAKTHLDDPYHDNNSLYWEKELERIEQKLKMLINKKDVRK